MNKIQYNTLVLCLAISYPFRKNYTANVCGHRTKKTGQITSLGDKHTVSMPLSENNNPEYCLDCIAKMSIKFAQCDNPIHIGDPVTLYEPFKVPEGAVRYDKDERCLVGCLGWDCAESGADHQGFWIPPGKVLRVPSPLEMLMSAGNESKAVIVKDLFDPSAIGIVIR